MRQPIKILFITLRADFGGGPEHMYQLLKNLSPAIEPYIAAPVDYPYWDKYRLLVRGQRMFILPHRRFSFSYLLDLMHFCREQKIDLIHSHGKGAGIYSRLLKLFTGIKVIHTYHGLHIGEYSPLKKTIYISIEKFFSALTTTAISVSPSEKYNLLLNGIIDSEKLHIISNGVEIPADNEIASPTQDPFHILSVTRFDYAKNSMMLVRIAKELSAMKQENQQFVFDIVGDGGDKQAVQRSLKENNLENLFVFHGMKDEMSPYYRSAGCLLSTSRWEGLPLSVLEAMSYGVPAVASNVIGNRDLVKDGETGFLYELAAPNDAAKRILQLAGDQTLWQAISANARKLILENYSAKKMAEQTEELYLRQIH